MEPRQKSSVPEAAAEKVEGGVLEDEIRNEFKETKEPETKSNEYANSSSDDFYTNSYVRFDAATAAAIAASLPVNQRSVLDFTKPISSIGLPGEPFSPNVTTSPIVIGETNSRVMFDSGAALGDGHITANATEASGEVMLSASGSGRRSERTEKQYSLEEGSIVSNFRLAIDQSVVAGLLDHAYTDARFEVMGYLGGIIKNLNTKQSVNDNSKAGVANETTSSGEVLCHVNHFIASERSIKSLISSTNDSVIEESESAYAIALRTFRSMGLDLVGWYRSSHRNGKLEPRAQDLFKQQRLQVKHKHSVGMLISVPTLPRLSIFSSTPSYDEMVNEMVPFRVPMPRKGLSKLLQENLTTLNGITNGQTNPSSTGNDVTNSNRSVPKPHRVVFGVNQQVCLSPGEMKQMVHTLQVALNESKQLYQMQEKDLRSDCKQTIFMQNEYYSFLMNSLRDSLGQLNQGVSQEYRNLALNKHYLKTQLAHRLDQISDVVEEYQHRKREWERFQGEQQGTGQGEDSEMKISEEAEEGSSRSVLDRRREVLDRLVWAILQENAYVESQEGGSMDMQSKLNVLYWNHGEGLKRANKRNTSGGGRRSKNVTTTDDPVTEVISEQVDVD